MRPKRLHLAAALFVMAAFSAVVPVASTITRTRRSSSNGISCCSRTLRGHFRDRRFAGKLYAGGRLHLRQLHGTSQTVLSVLACAEGSDFCA